MGPPDIERLKNKTLILQQHFETWAKILLKRTWFCRRAPARYKMPVYRPEGQGPQSQVLLHWSTMLALIT